MSCHLVLQVPVPHACVWLSCHLVLQVPVPHTCVYDEVEGVVERPRQLACRRRAGAVGTQCIGWRQGVYDAGRKSNYCLLGIAPSGGEAGERMPGQLHVLSKGPLSALERTPWVGLQAGAPVLTCATCGFARSWRYTLNYYV